MALISIYDLNGIEHKRETVDARELEELGWTREPKEVVSEAQEEQPESVKRGRKPKAE